MKIIFLDIDGVLNSEIYFIERYKNAKKGDGDPSMLDEGLIKNLNDIVDKTGAEIVISSSWRASGLDECNDKLTEKGLIKKAISITPHLYFEKNKYDYSYSVPRGCEIKAWIEMNKGIINEKVSKLRYAILDDDSDMLYWQRESFFWCDPYAGLTTNIAFKVIQHLNK
jgi:hypothetical protein